MRFLRTTTTVRAAALLVLASTAILLRYHFDATSLKRIARLSKRAYMRTAWKRPLNEFAESITKDYSDLWGLLDDLKNFWFQILSAEDISNANLALLDGYRVIHCRIQGSIAVHKAEICECLQDLLHEFDDFWAFIRSCMRENKKKNVKEINHRYGKMRSSLLQAIGASNKTRSAGLRTLGRRVHRKLIRLQNPKSCSTARILICKIINNSGFGSELHWLTNCLINAYENNRTAVQRSERWHYSKSGWEYAFLPLSSCEYKGSLSNLPGLNDHSAQVVLWDVSDRNREVWSIPAEIASDLTKIHAHPIAWWLSQFVTFATRYQPWVTDKIKEIAAKIRFQSPVVGMHIRRGDKLRREADRFEDDEYMFFVEQWFNELESKQRIQQRTVYLATDDQEAMPGLKKKYPRYNFISSGAQRTSSRDMVALEEIIMDLHFLSHCDYVVCTHSSNVCRAVYERMMDVQTDAPLRLQSIDTMYHFIASEKKIPWVAISNHTAFTEKEINLEVGNKVILFTKSSTPSNNGFVMAKNMARRKKRRPGFVPAYKIREAVSTKKYYIP